jgi:hypothetical protein
MSMLDTRIPVVYKYWDEFWSCYQTRLAGYLVGPMFHPHRTHCPDTEPFPADQLNWFSDGKESGYTIDERAVRHVLSAALWKVASSGGVSFPEVKED